MQQNEQLSYYNKIKENYQEILTILQELKEENEEKVKSPPQELNGKRTDN